MSEPKNQTKLRFARMTQCLSINAKPLSEAEIAEGKRLDADLPTRPATRGECLTGGWNQERPCPFVSCRHHLLLDVNHKGSLWLNAPIETLYDASCGDTCSLDVADRGACTLEQVGSVLHVTRERVRQIEAAALKKVKAGVPPETMALLGAESGVPMFEGP